MKAIHFLTLLLAVVTFASCDDNNTTGATQDLSDLQVSIVVIDQTTGQVASTHTALNANSYEIDFGDGAVVNTGANYVEHTYQSSGVFTIVVKAFDSEERFLKYEDDVVIDFGDVSNLHEGYTTPLSYEGMELIFAEEFDSPTIDASIWTHEIGNGCPNLCGWGNNEWQYYRSQNTLVENGLANIQAKNESFEGANYTSSRMITQGKFAFQYGRVDIRAKLPRGQGLWPALWMLGSNIDQVGWPACGEVDIMEMVGNRESTTYGTAHWDNNGSYASHGNSYDNTEDLDQEFHVYSIVWTEQSIKWYFDDLVYNTLDITSASLSEFRAPMFLIMNVAVGGNWPGYPNPSTEFPTSMEVDYVRVFQ